MRPLSGHSARPRYYVCLRCCLQQRARFTRQQRASHTSLPCKQEQRGVLAVLEERGYVNQIAGCVHTLI